MFWTKTTPQDFMPKSTVEALKANFDEHEMAELSRFATHVTVEAGTALTVEGTHGQQALIMIEGTAAVMRNDEKIATINAGEIIGEIALLSGERRMATVITETDATLYALSPRDFASLLASCPRLEERVTNTAIHRVAAA